MTDDDKAKEKADRARRRSTNAITVAAFALVALAGVGVLVGPRIQRRHWGTTPQQLMDEPLPHDEAQVGRDLHLATIDPYHSQVTARLRTGVADPYTKVVYTFGALTDAPIEMRLVAQGKGLAARGARVRAALAHHVRLKDDAFSWGAIHVEVNPSTAEVWFQVKPSTGVSATAHQIDAARQLVLGAAFGLPTHMTAREIDDAIGAGYPTAEIGKLDLATTLPDAETLLKKRFPAMLHLSTVTFLVPLDHPIVRAVRLDWQDGPGGHLAHVEPDVAHAYGAVRTRLEACLEKQLGPPEVAPDGKERTFVAGSLELRLGAALNIVTRGDAITSGLDRVFRALDACRVE
jgi:hypothetical protein